MLTNDAVRLAANVWLNSTSFHFDCSNFYFFYFPAPNVMCSNLFPSIWGIFWHDLEVHWTSKSSEESSGGDVYKNESNHYFLECIDTLVKQPLSLFYWNATSNKNKLSIHFHSDVMSRHQSIYCQQKDSNTICLLRSCWGSESKRDIKTKYQMSFYQPGPNTVGARSPIIIVNRSKPTDICWTKLSQLDRNVSLKESQ